MTLYRCFDAATPPAIAPPGCTAVLGYIGREHYTPHIWTLEEWGRFDLIRQFPAWVPDLAEAPVIEASAAAAAARSLGWAPYQGNRRAVVFDFETADTAADRGWWAACAFELKRQGFAGVLYGSLSTVLANAASYVWAAAWDNSATLLPGQTIVAHQYQDAGSVDYSVMGQWLFDRGGRGPRHA